MISTLIILYLSCLRAKVIAPRPGCRAESLRRRPGVGLGLQDGYRYAGNNFYLIGRRYAHGKKDEEMFMPADGCGSDARGNPAAGGSGCTGERAGSPGRPDGSQRGS